MVSLKICPVCSRPFHKTMGLAFHMVDIHPEYQPRRRLEVTVNGENAGPGVGDKAREGGQDLPSVG